MALTLLTHLSRYLIGFVTGAYIVILYSDLRWRSYAYIYQLHMGLNLRTFISFAIWGVGYLLFYTLFNRQSKPRLTMTDFLANLSEQQLWDLILLAGYTVLFQSVCWLIYRLL